MMRFALLIVVLFSQFKLRGQDEHGHDWVARKTAKGDTSCSGYYTKLAKDDLGRGTALLFIEPGCWVTTLPSQYKFEQRYGVRYNKPGCALPDRRECLTIYNDLVFRHLDSTNGRKWRRTVRTDVLGYRRRFWIFR